MALYMLSRESSRCEDLIGVLDANFTKYLGQLIRTSNGPER